MVTGAELVQNPTRYKVAIGSTVMLQCTPPSGVPDPTTSWKFISISSETPEPLQTSQSVQLEDNGKRVVFSNVQLSHIGDYICNASNLAGSRSDDVVLNVFDPGE